VVTLRLTVRDFRESEAERRHKELKAAKRAEYEAARQKAIAAAQLQAKKTSVQEQTEPEKKNAEVASAETKTAASPSATPGEIIAATPLTSTDPAVREAVASSIEAERKVIEMEKEHFNDISDEESQSAEASATTPHNNDVQPTVEATKSPPTGERNQYFRHGRIVSSQELQLWKVCLRPRVQPSSLMYLLTVAVTATIVYRSMACFQRPIYRRRFLNSTRRWSLRN